MRFEVELSENFKKEAKKLVKRYPSLKIELFNLFTLLENNPTTGTPLGNDIYKIRWPLLQKIKVGLVERG